MNYAACQMIRRDGLNPLDQAQRAIADVTETGQSACSNEIWIEYLSVGSVYGRLVADGDCLRHALERKMVLGNSFNSWNIKRRTCCHDAAAFWIYVLGSSKCCSRSPDWPMVVFRVHGGADPVVCARIRALI